MSQWMDDGGFYEGMTMEAQSKHLAKLISKRCPSCQAQIEKNEGCLQYVQQHIYIILHQITAHHITAEHIGAFNRRFHPERLTINTLVITLFPV